MTLDLHAEAGRALEARRRFLAEAVTARCFEARPDLLSRYGEQGRSECLKDTEYHLSYLAEALATASPSLFVDYVAWAKVMLATRNIPSEDLASNLEALCEALRGELPNGLGDVVCEYIESGLLALGKPLPAVEACETDPLYDLSRRYTSTLLDGKRHAASRLIQQSVEAGVSIRDLYLHVFQRSQHEIGRLWQTNQLSVAQEHYCTAATQLIMSQLYPYILSTEKNGRSLVATCVAGDLHEIGIRMVSDFFEMEGWDTFYLGANTPAPSVIRTLVDRKADVLAVSATMGFHVRAVAELIAAVRAGSANGVKVIVGGYPFNIDSDLWRRVGADGSAPDALASVALAEQLAGEGD